MDLAIEIFAEIAEELIPVVFKGIAKLFKCIGRFFVWLFGKIKCRSELE